MQFKKGDCIPDLKLTQKNGESWRLYAQERSKTLLFLLSPFNIDSSLFNSSFVQLRDNMKFWRAMQVSVIAICPGMTEKQISQLHKQLNLNFELLPDPASMSDHSWNLEEMFDQMEDQSIEDWFVMLVDEGYRVAHTESGKSSEGVPDFNKLLKRLMINDL